MELEWKRKKDDLAVTNSEAIASILPGRGKPDGIE